MLEVKLEDVSTDYDHCQDLVLIHNGKEILRRSDGGEPEDQFFLRAWYWVPDAIELAYKLGKEDAIEQP